MYSLSHKYHDPRVLVQVFQPLKDLLRDFARAQMQVSLLLPNRCSTWDIDRAQARRDVQRWMTWVHHDVAVVDVA